MNAQRAIVYACGCLGSLTVVLLMLQYLRYDAAGDERTNGASPRAVTSSLTAHTSETPFTAGADNNGQPSRSGVAARVAMYVNHSSTTTYEGLIQYARMLAEGHAYDEVVELLLPLYTNGTWYMSSNSLPLNMLELLGNALANVQRHQGATNVLAVLMALLTNSAAPHVEIADCALTLAVSSQALHNDELCAMWWHTAYQYADTADRRKTAYASYLLSMCRLDHIAHKEALFSYARDNIDHNSYLYQHIRQAYLHDVRQQALRCALDDLDGPAYGLSDSTRATPAVLSRIKRDVDKNIEQIVKREEQLFDEVVGRNP